jgi:hypothetical protein
MASQKDRDQIIAALRAHVISMGYEAQLRHCNPFIPTGKQTSHPVVPPGFLILDALGEGKHIEVEDDYGEVTIFAPKTHWHLDHLDHIQYGIEILDGLLVNDGASS